MRRAIATILLLTGCQPEVERLPAETTIPTTPTATPPQRSDAHGLLTTTGRLDPGYSGSQWYVYAPRDDISAYEAARIAPVFTWDHRKREERDGFTGIDIDVAAGTTFISLYPHDLDYLGSAARHFRLLGE